MSWLRVCILLLCESAENFIALKTFVDAGMQLLQSHHDS
eukprot:SAG11_NODE_37418_length_257_cov_0.632911_1_plen_38_part_10